MNYRDVARGALLLISGALTVALTAGCQGNSSGSGTVSGGSSAPYSAPSGQNSSGTVPAGSVSPATSALTGSGGGRALGTGTRPVAVPECTARQLKLGVQGDEGASGTNFHDLVFTNSGSADCVMAGFAGVSFVTGDNGQQVGAAASRYGAIGPQLTLHPGQSAYALVGIRQTSTYDPAAACGPTSLRGFRVYAPDDTAAMFVPFTDPDDNGNVCANPNLPVGQLEVATVMSSPRS